MSEATADAWLAAWAEEAARDGLERGSTYWEGVVAIRPRSPRLGWPLSRDRTSGRGAGARPLSRCYEGTEASARAWLEVASFGYLLGRV